MKIYVTSRFKGSSENKVEIETLCAAVREAGVEDFHFIRDIEQYQANFFKSQKDLWQASRDCISDCDALLIDVSDNPGGGRVIEAGIAYALNKPIFVIVKNGIKYKDIYNGIATQIFSYDNFRDITGKLSAYLRT